MTTKTGRNVMDTNQISGIWELTEAPQVTALKGSTVWRIGIVP